MKYTDTKPEQNHEDQSGNSKTVKVISGVKVEERSQEVDLTSTKGQRPVHEKPLHVYVVEEHHEGWSLVEVKSPWYYG